MSTKDIWVNRWHHLITFGFCYVWKYIHAFIQCRIQVYKLSQQSDWSFIEMSSRDGLGWKMVCVSVRLHQKWLCTYNTRLHTHKYIFWGAILRWRSLSPPSCGFLPLSIFLSFKASHLNAHTHTEQLHTSATETCESDARSNMAWSHARMCAASGLYIGCAPTCLSF